MSQQQPNQARVSWFLTEDGKKKPMLNPDGNPYLNLGKAHLGQEARMDLYMRNDEDFAVSYKPLTTDKDLAVSIYPETLLPGKFAHVSVVFRPSLGRGLRPLEGSFQFEAESVPRWQAEMR